VICLDSEFAFGHVRCVSDACLLTLTGRRRISRQVLIVILLLNVSTNVAHLHQLLKENGLLAAESLRCCLSFVEYYDSLSLISCQLACLSACVCMYVCMCFVNDIKSSKSWTGFSNTWSACVYF